MYIYIMSDQERGFEYMPTYPSHEDDDVYDYVYILTYDFTVDPIIIIIICIGDLAGKLKKESF